MSIADDDPNTQPDDTYPGSLSEILRVERPRSRPPVPYLDESFDQPEYRGTIRSYIVAATERSGSTLLCDLLYRSGLMGVPAEYFSSGPVAVPLATRFGTVYPSGAVNVRAYLRELLRRRTTANGVFGMNLHHWQMLQITYRAPLSALLKQSRYVWLRRRDLLGQAISLAIARTTNEWYRPTGSEAPPPDPPVDLVAIRRELAYLGVSTFEWQRYFDFNRITPLELYYEDLVADVDGVCREVCRLAGLRQVPRFDLGHSGYARQSGPANARWREAYEATLKIQPRQP